MDPTAHLNIFIDDREGYGWRRSGPGRFRLTSGLWKAGPWEHDVVVIRPATMTDGETAILYITGGDVNDSDLAEARALANRASLTVAMLFHIPNQPIFDLWEDDLIAHTFEQYLDTGDAAWPLLYPMTRAAIRAMDMLEENGFRRFVVTGASKRGWTTWLAGGAGDERIAGIAPMVIDNLNFPAQMAHQVETWGGYSEQIEDYTSRDLQDSMDTERGAELTVMMDPIHYVDRIQCPILIVNGANDRYWTVDALSLYWDRLPPTTRCLIVPNAGHLLGDKRLMIETVGEFAAAAAFDVTLPEVQAELVCTDSVVGLWAHGDFVEARLWAAYAENLDFRDSEWIGTSPFGLPHPDWPTARLEQELLVLKTRTGDRDGDVETAPVSLRASVRADVDLPTRDNVALMAEMRFQGAIGRFSLSSPVEVFKKRFSPQET